MDEDGCPDNRSNADTDKDGVADGIDECPFDMEDIDQFEDADGCPDLDNDDDGIPDFEDQCPNAREVFNRVDDTDGCPDESDRVRVRKNRIEISQKIYFDFAKSTIKSQSSDLIDEIASLIRAENSSETSSYQKKVRTSTMTTFLNENHCFKGSKERKIDQKASQYAF